MTKLYDYCPHCGAVCYPARPWRDAFCDETCHESYLERRKRYYEIKHPTKVIKRIRK